jgi:hypothetical protein
MGGASGLDMWAASISDSCSSIAGRVSYSVGACRMIPAVPTEKIRFFTKIYIEIQRCVTTNSKVMSVHICQEIRFFKKMRYSKEPSVSLKNREQTLLKNVSNNAFYFFYKTDPYFDSYDATPYIFSIKKRRRFKFLFC